MADDGSSRRTSGDGRLWTEPREAEEQQTWLKPRATVGPSAPLRAPEEPHPGEDRRAARRRRLTRNALLATLAIFAIVGAAFLAGSLLGGVDSVQRPAALPVVPGASPADQRSRTVRAIYAAASPSVVSVRVREGSSSSSGTGFVIAGADPGTIVTNAHVVGSAAGAQVRLQDDGPLIDAKVAGRDESSDLAVLKVDPSTLSGIRPLALAESNNVQVGDLAVAIGYPLGLDRTATAGIVSGVGRSITAPNNFQIDKVIQTDAPINPGNSGGPLLDSAGRVIGVNSQIATAGGGGNVGIGFAVPSDSVRHVVPRLQRGTAIRRPYLGISTIDTLTSQGAIVGRVVPSGPGEGAGLRTGDIVTKVGGFPVRAPDDVARSLEGLQPGASVDIEVRRRGSRRTLHATLGTRPQGGP
jgi:putative serine protease PepD